MPGPGPPASGAPSRSSSIGRAKDSRRWPGAQKHAGHHHLLLVEQAGPRCYQVPRDVREDVEAAFSSRAQRIPDGRSRGGRLAASPTNSWGLRAATAPSWAKVAGLGVRGQGRRGRPRARAARARPVMRVTWKRCRGLPAAGRRRSRSPAPSTGRWSELRVGVVVDEGEAPALRQPADRQQLGGGDYRPGGIAGLLRMSARVRGLTNFATDDGKAVLPPGEREHRPPACEPHRFGEGRPAGRGDDGLTPGRAGAWHARVEPSTGDRDLLGGEATSKS